MERREPAQADHMTVQPITRIVVSSDFIMTREDEQMSNLRWLTDLLRRPVERASGILLDSFSASVHQKTAFSRAHFFELSGIELDTRTTHFYFDAQQISEASLDYLSRHVTPRELVIGYELSPQTRSLLSRLGVPWIDMWLHPIRFLDDILFGFTASNEAAHSAMLPFHVNDDVIQLHADRLKIEYYKGYRRPNLPIAPGAALFVGQTLEDKAVCDRGKMLNLLDFQIQFEQAGAQFGKVYYSRHPYVKTGDEAIMRYIRGCRFAQLVDYPSYQMLASGQLAKAFSISSSVVHEARYFGMDTEFLFRPVLTYGTKFGVDHLSIYQEFVSPHFWSAVLAPYLATRSCARVMFLERKDKLRDMLNFYWNYRQVDKLEETRQGLQLIERAVQSMRAKVAATATALNESTGKLAIPERPGQSWEEVLAEATAQISSHEVVSFDVFDTLLVRPFEEPSDLFYLLSAEVRALVGDSILNFVEARRNARTLVTDGRHGEEITLTERYRALAKQHGLDEEMAARFEELEKDLERRFCSRRKAGWELHETALRLGRKIIYLSDTYFDEEFVRELLTSAGYKIGDGLFVSSRHQKLKATGNLFPLVTAKLKVNPSSVLHIGDNPESDVKLAQAAGLHTWYLPSRTDAFKRSKLSGKLNITHSLTHSVIRSLIAARLSDNPWGLPSPSYVGGEPVALGYAAAGPMFFGFAKWILEESIRDGVDVLYFLSRDGDIVKRCYDILAPCYAGAPKSVYLLASRRSANIAALRTSEDIQHVLQVNFDPVSLENLLRNRFGLEQISDDLLRQSGFTSQTEVDFKKDEAKLRALFAELSPAILENAAREREALLDYYRKMDFRQSDARLAIVDIGHNGTLQASLSSLIGDPNLGGYYFVTYDEIRERVHARGMPAKAYLAEGISSTNRSHPYCRHLLMFEALFLNDEGSFVRMMKQDFELVPVQLPVGGETERVELSRQVHQGVQEFCTEIVRLFGTNLPDFGLEGPDAISGYVGLLNDAAAIDARMFRGIKFENVYSGRDVRYLIEPDDRDAEESVSRSIWREGARVLLQEKLSQQRSGAGLSWRQRLLREVIRRTSSPRKYEKFLKSPEAFFADSNKPLVRLLGRWMVNSN